MSEEVEAKHAIVRASRCDEAAGSEHGVVELLVQELQAIWSRGAMSTLVNVGELIVRYCYEGDIERWRGRGSNQRVRALENHPRLPFPRKTVYLGLHIYDLGLRLGASPILSELGIGHVRAVLGLPQGDQQRLLEEARSNDWTIAQLTEHVSELRRRSTRKSGRPPLAPAVRKIRDIGRHVTALESLLIAHAVALGCDPATVGRVLAALAELKEQVWESESRKTA